MTIQHFTQAIQDCDNSNFTFNLGENKAFLYKKSWYPLRALMNYASTFAGEKNNLTTNEALVELTILLDWVRIEKIYFTAHTSVPIDNHQIIENTKQLATILYDLIN